MLLQKTRSIVAFVVQKKGHYRPIWAIASFAIV